MSKSLPFTLMLESMSSELYKKYILFARFYFAGNVKPFVLYAVTDQNEAVDIGNRGFALAYAQNLCPVISK